MMKKIISIIFLLFFIVNPTVNIHAQETSPKHKKFKEMKLNFILDNTDMSNEEAEHFQCVLVIMRINITHRYGLKNVK